MKKRYQYNKESNSGIYEHLTSRSRGICIDLVILANELKHNEGTEHWEKNRIKKIDKEIELIREHKEFCRDYATLVRMGKTIKHLEVLKRKPDAKFE